MTRPRAQPAPAPREAPSSRLVPSSEPNQPPDAPPERPPTPRPSLRMTPSQAPAAPARLPSRVKDTAAIAALEAAATREGESAPPCCTDAPVNLDVGRHVWLEPGETLLNQYYARKREPKFRVLIFLVLFIPWLIPGLLYVLWYFLAARAHGVIGLTNRRLLYVEFSSGVLGEDWSSTSFDLRTIAGVRCYAQHGITKFLGIFVTQEKKAFLFQVQSRYPTQFAIGGLTAVTSSLFEPADSAVEMSQEIGGRILEIQAGLS
ncbi:MAG: hypothetical protein HYZ53_26475 [Planctomycetes bacterium]|nr:hypothetical protein [Planctomycetota bacterium]